MRKNLPPLNALRAFEAAGRTGSFSSAGNELNVSHSSISRHVRGLEASIGVQLFKNMPRGVELTRSGKAYWERISRAFDEISDATNQLTPSDGSLVTLSCEPTFALKWLMLAIGEFHEKYPQIRIEIDTKTELADLLRNECDVALRFCSREYEGLESDVISESPMYPVGAPTLFGDLEGMPTKQQLSGAKFLQENHAEFWDAWMAKTGIKRARLDRKSGMLRTMFAIEAAIAGQGLALVSMELVHNDIKAGRLRKYSDIGLQHGTYRLVYTKAALRSKPLRLFREWLLGATTELRQARVD